MAEWIRPLQAVFRAWDNDKTKGHPTVEDQARALAAAATRYAERLASIKADQPTDQAIVDGARAAFQAIALEIERSSSPGFVESPESEATAQTAADALDSIGAQVRAMRPPKRGWSRAGQP